LEPFDATQAPASVKEARAIISQAKATLATATTSGKEQQQLISETGFVWLSLVLVSEALPEQVQRTPALNACSCALCVCVTV
jgi:hypothetical protein